MDDAGRYVNKYVAKSFNIFHSLIKMTAEERQQRIEEHIQQVEFASLEELSNHVEASISTVRRDLNVLEKAGSIRRTHAVPG